MQGTTAKNKHILKGLKSSLGTLFDLLDLD